MKCDSRHFTQSQSSSLVSDVILASRSTANMGHRPYKSENSLFVASQPFKHFHTWQVRWNGNEGQVSSLYEVRHRMFLWQLLWTYHMPSALWNIFPCQCRGDPPRYYGDIFWHVAYVSKGSCYQGFTHDEKIHHQQACYYRVVKLCFLCKSKAPYELSYLHFQRHKT